MRNFLFLLMVTFGLCNSSLVCLYAVFNEDGLTTSHNHEFIDDPRFIRAYQRGLKSGGLFPGSWRTKVVLWAATQANKLEGAFVECGVNRGFLTSAILDYLDWNTLNRDFFLFDTFSGLDSAQLSEEEFRRRFVYSECYEATKQNFSEFKNIHIVRGVIPYSLTEIDIPSIAYLSIDLNCAAPEVAALEFFWPKLVHGAVVVLDDYAYAGYESQFKAMNDFAIRKGIEILPLPTGQGLIIKN